MPDSFRSNPTAVKAYVYASVLFSGLALALTIIGIVALWFLTWFLGNAIIDLSVGIENTAQAAQRGVQRLDTGISNARSELQDIEQAVQQLSQNLNDDGLIRTLLPPEKEARLDANIQSLTDTIDSVMDLIASIRDVYRTVNRIPGVNLPQPNQEQIDNIRTTSANLQSAAQDVSDAIAAVRAKQSNAVERLGAPASKLDDGLETIQTDLQTLNNAMATTQVRAQRMRQTLPTLLVIIAVLVTLVALWIAWTQVVMIRNGWREWKALHSQPIAEQSAVPS